MASPRNDHGIKRRPSGRPFYSIGSATPFFATALASPACGRLIRRGIVGPSDSGGSGRNMAETADDLSTPLGQETVAKKRRRLRLPFTATQAVAVLMGLFLLAFLGFAIFNDNPLGGEPGARVAIRTASPAEKPAAASVDTPAPAVKSAAEMAKPADPAGKRTVTIIDGSSGARHDVVVPGDAPDKAESEAAPALMSGVDQRLLEKSRYGMIPVTADDLNPFTAYAGGTEADRARAARMPSIAIVIGGLGVGA